VRVSTAHFNNEADYDKFFAAIDHIIRGE
jgi:selenocysteine lyase/cysteine desulfurase